MHSNSKEKRKTKQTKKRFYFGEITKWVRRFICMSLHLCTVCKDLVHHEIFFILLWPPHTPVYGDCGFSVGHLMCWSFENEEKEFSLTIILSFRMHRSSFTFSFTEYPKKMMRFLCSSIVLSMEISFFFFSLPFVSVETITDRCINCFTVNFNSINIYYWSEIHEWKHERNECTTLQLNEFQINEIKIEKKKFLRCWWWWDGEEEQTKA